MVLLAVALLSIEVGDDQCWLVVLHFRRCQSILLASPQISRFGHSDDGDFLGAVHSLTFVGSYRRFALRRAYTLRQLCYRGENSSNCLTRNTIIGVATFLHDASFTDAAVCLVACFYFGKGVEEEEN